LLVPEIRLFGAQLEVALHGFSSSGFQGFVLEVAFRGSLNFLRRCTTAPGVGNQFAGTGITLAGSPFETAGGSFRSQLVCRWPSRILALADVLASGLIAAAAPPRGVGVARLTAGPLAGLGDLIAGGGLCGTRAGCSFGFFSA
jgi:hypothetical protein